MLNRQDYGRRADQLDLKEKELRAKEAELRKLEQDLRATGGLKPEKNWPPCCAFTHHDIAGEVRAVPAMQPGFYDLTMKPKHCLYPVTSPHCHHWWHGGAVFVQYCSGC